MKDIGVDYSTEMNTGSPTTAALEGHGCAGDGRLSRHRIRDCEGAGRAAARRSSSPAAIAADLERAQAELGGSAFGVAADVRNRGGGRGRGARRRWIDSAASTCWSTTPASGCSGTSPTCRSRTGRTTIDTNLTGVFYYCHAAIPHLRKRGGGWIINISSLAGKNPFVGGAAYCASKAGLNAFSEALMQEVRYDNIRVTCVMPGSVATGFGAQRHADRPDWKIQPEDVGQVVVDLLLMPARSLPSRVELRPSKPPQK